MKQRDCHEHVVTVKESRMIDTNVRKSNMAVELTLIEQQSEADYVTYVTKY
jgi:hypothetical protein